MESGILVSGDSGDTPGIIDEKETESTLGKSARVALFWPGEKKYGEAFERYYRKELLRRTGNPVRLIATEPLLKVSSVELVNEVFSERQKPLLGVAGRLAEEIYRLSSEAWDSNPNAYLRIIDKHIALLSTADSRFVLRHSQRIFKERFGEIIRDRGESIDLLDQIVKRTGDETEEGFLKVISGVEVTDLAWRVWGLVQRYTPDVPQKIERILFDLTDYQIRELRLEFNTLPAILLAREIHRAMHAAPDPPEPTEEELQLLRQAEEEQEEWNEEEDPWGFTRVEKVEVEVEKYVIDFEALRYLLRGKTVEELALIEFQFNDIFHRQAGENTLRGQVRDRLISWKAAEVLDLLAGYDPKKEAAKVSDIFWDDDRIATDEITPDSESDEFIGEVDGGGDLFLRAQLSGRWPLYEDLAGRLRKVRLLCSDMAVWEREYDALPQLRRAVRHLSRQQLEEVNAVLAEEHGFELDLALYRNGIAFHARSIVEEIITFLPRASTLREILDFFEFRAPEDIAEIKRVYGFVVGRDLFRDVQNRIRMLCGENIPSTLTQTITRRLSGIPRIKLEQDLLLPYSPQVVNAPDHSLHEDVLKNFFRLATSHSWSALLSALKELLPVQRLEVEDYIWTKKRELDQPETLRDLLLKFSDDLAAHEALILLTGFDAQEAAQRIQHDITELSTLRAELPESIELVLRILSEEGFDLAEQIEMAEAESAIECMKPYLKTILFAQSAFDLGGVLKRFRPLESEELDSLAQQLSRSFEDVCAFERAFDRLFGSLRLLLKQLTSAGCIERKVLASAILRLEAANPELHSRLHKLVEIGDFESVQRLFKDERDHLITLEECYDIVYEENELRAALNHMDASLNAICRCLLLLDGYDPQAVADEIHDRLHNSSGSAIVQEVIQYLRPSTEEYPNPYIPEDMNWVDEMYLQIRIAYREKHEQELLPLLVERGIDEEQHKQLAYTVYGTRTAEKAAEVYSALRGKDSAKAGIDKARKALGTIDPRLRECVVSLYNAYFAVRPGHRTLELEVKAAPGDPDAKAKLLKIVKDAEQAIYL